LHDAITGDKIGVPSAGVMTSAFVSAAELMARVLGCEGYRFVIIEHPISSASTEMLQIRARQAALDCEAVFLGQSPQA
jgi:hypothetical protein